MKNFFNKSSFLIKMALRNIFSSKLRAFVLFFSSTIIVILIFVVFSLNGFFTGFFESYYKEEKGNSDIYISIDENYGARYFSIRNLEENLTDDHYKHVVSYFKIASLSYNEEDYSYVNIIMSNLHDFKKTGNLIQYPFDLLANDEIIITKSFATDKNLKEEDVLFLEMGSDKILYKIVAIVEDGGLIKGSTVFIDKNSNIKNILTAIYPELNSLNPMFFNKLCNGAYLYISEGKDNSEVINILNSIDEYQNLIISESINKEEIIAIVNRNIAYFSVGIALVLLSILFVVQSSLIVIFNDRLKQLGIIRTLGGTQKDFLMIIIFEILFYLFLAIILGPILCLITLKFGLNLIGSNYVFTINFINLIYTFLTLIVLYGIIVFFSFLKVKKLAIHSILKTSKFKTVNWVVTSFLFMISIFLFVLNNLYLRSYDTLKYKGLFNYILIIIIGIILVKIILRLVSYIFKKKTVFGLIFIDDVYRNKITKSIIIVLLVAFTSIVIFVGLSRVDERRIESLYEQTLVDLAITNIIKEDDLENFLNNNDEVDFYDKGFLYNNIILNNQNISLQMISTNNFQYYFEFGLETSIIEEFNNTDKAFIILPLEYQFLYNYKVGDEVSLEITEIFNDESFEIIGFFQSKYEELMLTNVSLLDIYESMNYNTVFIKSNNKNLLKNELTNKYSNNLYYIIDFKEFIKDIDIYSRNLRHFLTFISMFFVFCFIFTILNNSILLFESNKNLFARMKIIGCSKKTLTKNIIYQYLLIAFVCVVSSFLVIFVNMNNVKYILLFFNVYQEVNLILSDYLLGYFISVMVFFISYLYYLRLVLNLNVNETIKEVE